MAQWARICLIPGLILLAGGAAPWGWAIPNDPGRSFVGAGPSAAEAEAAFRAARAAYRAVAAGAPAAESGVLAPAADPTVTFVPGTSVGVPLERVNLVLDVEHQSLREVVANVVEQAAVYTGPWTVKWRLKPENLSLMEEKVNLTAEAPVDTFFALLAERVRNLTGTQLFITTFHSARVILVADTYY